MEGLRERKKLQTRQALGLAAMRLAVDRGLHNVRIEDVAAQAGVSTRTFNNYFASKHEAICALAVDRARQIGDELRARPGSEPFWQAVTQAVLAQYGIDEVPDAEWIAGVRLVTGEPALVGEHLKAQAEMGRTLAEAIGERLGSGRGDLLPQLVAGAVTIAVDAALERWLAADPPTAPGPLVRRNLRTVAAYLTVPVAATALVTKTKTGTGTGTEERT
jgi:AcrR family transcriptional regulator